MRSILIALCCSILLVGVAFAQTDRGTITGTITDQAGAVIPGAQIEATNINTGSVFRTESSSTGNYTISQLPVGKYQLSASMPGFKQFMRTGITVMVAQTLRINIELGVGDISETVTVSADAPLLRTESGELSHNVSSETLNELPIMGFGGTLRDPYAVTLLVPGAYYLERTEVRVGGTPSNSESIRVEGQDATNNMRLGMTQQNQASVDAIEEFSVQTSNYSAEYGQAGGAFFNITMKSGSNAFHGTVYDYWVNEAFNASTPFINTKSRQRKHNYGFTIGGPVWIPGLYDGHDKTFFFFNWEQFREKLIYSDYPWTVPTAAYRSGDFSAAITGRVLGQDPLGRDIIEGTIYDPQTERLVGDKRVRDPFLNNTIPPDRFDPVAAKIQALIPQATDATALVYNYLNPWESTNIRDVPALKIDHNLSTSAKLSFYWSDTSLHTRNQTGPNGGDGIDSPVTGSRALDSDSSTFRLNYDHTLTPNMLLHLGAGVLTQKWALPSNYTDFDQMKELGLPGAYSTYFPYISGLETSYGGMKAMGPLLQRTSQNIKPTANASFTWVKGNHTYKFGAEMRVEGLPTAILTASYGRYNFAAEQTGLPSTLGQNLQGGSVGFPYASFLLGHVDSGNIGFPVNIRVGKSAWALFAQDSWKVTNKFTLDYGLRWDYQTYLKEQYGRVANFSPTTPNPSAGGLPGAVIFERDGVEFAKVYPYAFGPRLGAAYQLLPKTVLRLGFGITYGMTAAENSLSTQFGSDNPFDNPSYGDPAIQFSDGAPTPAPWPNLDPGQYPQSGTVQSPPFAFDHNAGRPPRIMQWSIGIQQELTQNLAVEISYVGNRGVWWEGDALLNVNALTPERIASFGLDVNSKDDQALLKARLDSATAASRGFDTPPYTGFPMSATVAQSLRPFPQFGSISYYWAPLGKTWYDSMQIKVVKRFSRGLDFSSTFSWQKELMLGSTESFAYLGGTQAAVNNVFDRKSNKYLSALSRPFVSVTAVNYTTPRFDGWNRVLSMLLSDWTIGAVLSYASGMPIRVPTAQSRLSSLLFQDTFANRVAGEPLWSPGVDINDRSTYDPYTDFLLNKNAWVDPPAGQFGVSPAYYSDYRYMRRPSEAMSLGRNFKLKEGITLNIRADFQNVFNRLVFGNPYSANAKSTQRSNPITGETTSGFGYINTTRSTSPRTGVIVFRLRF